MAALVEFPSQCEIDDEFEALQSIYSEVQSAIESALPYLLMLTNPFLPFWKFTDRNCGASHFLTGSIS